MQQQAKAGAFMGNGHTVLAVGGCTLSSTRCLQHPSIVDSVTAAFRAELIIS